MAYLNNELSIKGVHAELSAVRNANMWGVAMFEFGEDVYYIQPHKNGICAVNDCGKKVAFAKLKDHDNTDSNKQSLHYMLEELADKLYEITPDDIAEDEDEY